MKKKEITNMKKPLVFRSENDVLAYALKFVANRVASCAVVLEADVAAGLITSDTIEQYCEDAPFETSWIINHAIDFIKHLAKYVDSDPQDSDPQESEKLLQDMADYITNRTHTSDHPCLSLNELIALYGADRVKEYLNKYYENHED